MNKKNPINSFILEKKDEAFVYNTLLSSFFSNTGEENQVQSTICYISKCRYQVRKRTVTIHLYNVFMRFILPFEYEFFVLNSPRCSVCLLLYILTKNEKQLQALEYRMNCKKVIHMQVKLDTAIEVWFPFMWFVCANDLTV